MHRPPYLTHPFMSRLLAPQRLVLAGTLVVVGACGGEGPTDPSRNGDGGVRTLLGAGVTDTIDAQPLQALVVEVRDTDGDLLPGALVRFEAQRPADSTRASEPAIFVCRLSVPSCGGSGYYASSEFTVDTTDAQGKAKAMVRLGHVAGRASVRIAVPELGVVDTAEYTVLPGAVARVIAPADTTLRLGVTAKAPGRVTDRYRNPRAEVPTVTSASGTSILLASNGDITAREIGVQSLYFTYGSHADTTQVSVVPAGRLVVWRSSARSLIMVDLDGSKVRALMSGVSSDYGAFPSFDASRQRVTLHVGTESWGGSARRVVIVDTTGTVVRDVGSSAGFTTVVRAREVADGRLLVAGQVEGTNGIWTVAASGIVSLVTTMPDFMVSYGAADISPDGARVAYVARTPSYGSELRVRDLVSGAETVIETSASSPRWSPQGDRLAYLSSGGALTVANRDGSGRRVLGSRVYSPGLAWSPDGEYLVARSAGGYEWTASLWIVRIRDAVEVPVRFVLDGGVTDYFQPDWR